MEKQTGVP